MKKQLEAKNYTRITNQLRDWSTESIEYAYNNDGTFTVTIVLDKSK